MEKLGQSQNLKGEEDQELIQWINSPKNGSPAPATKSKRRGTSPALFLFSDTTKARPAGSDGADLD